MKGWKPEDIIVGMFALTIMYAIIMTGLTPLFIDMEKEGSSPEKAKIIAGLLSSIVSVVSMYVGAKLRNKDDED